MIASVASISPEFVGFATRWRTARARVSFSRATRSGHVFGAFGHHDPRVISILVHGKSGRRETGIGKRADGDRSELRCALELGPYGPEITTLLA
jgi:hypothetical protein